MRRSIPFVFALLLSGLLLTTPPALGADQDVTLEGSFIWNAPDQDYDGKLIGIFTPTGKDSWDVSFQFDWEGKPRVWKGNAEGNLSTGTLQGEVQADNPESTATFRFSGAFEGETFNGTHSMMREGELKEQGTLMLQAQGDKS